MILFPFPLKNTCNFVPQTYCSTLHFNPLKSFQFQLRFTKKLQLFHFPFESTEVIPLLFSRCSIQSKFSLLTPRNFRLFHFLLHPAQVNALFTSSHWSQSMFSFILLVSLLFHFQLQSSRVIAFATSLSLQQAYRFTFHYVPLQFKSIFAHAMQSLALRGRVKALQQRLLRNAHQINRFSCCFLWMSIARAIKIPSWR